MRHEKKVKEKEKKFNYGVGWVHREPDAYQRCILDEYTLLAVKEEYYGACFGDDEGKDDA